MRRLWIRLVPRHELIVLHHALRMVAQHPNVTGANKDEIERLADDLWSESVRRSP